MGHSADAYLGWGYDLGDSESSYDKEHLKPLWEREVEDEDSVDSFLSEWEAKALPALFYDVDAKEAAREAWYSERDARIAEVGRDVWRAEGGFELNMAKIEEIDGQFPMPVKVVHYGYEFSSTALVLSRSHHRSWDYGVVEVDVVTLREPSGEEIEALGRALVSLGLDPAAFGAPKLLLMAHYG